MKKILQQVKKQVILALGFILLTGSLALSQTEVTVDEGFNTLLDAVETNPGATLILKRGGSYIIDQAVEITTPTIIRGEDGPAETVPAVVSIYADPGTAKDKYLFSLAANTTIENLGLNGFTGDNQQIKGTLIVAARDLDIVMDGCVLQGGPAWTMWTGGNKNLHVVFKNNINYNMSYIGWDNYGGYAGLLWGGDSIYYEAVNNTYFVGGRMFGNGGSGPNGTQFMDHNSYVNTWGDVFFPVTDMDFTLKNSLLFNANIRGYVGLRYAENGVDTLWAGDYSDWTETDSLMGIFGVYPHLLDTVGGPRTVEVKNNMMMYEQRVMDFYADNNVTQMPFLNKDGWLYIDQYGWDIENNFLQDDGNEIDPQFAMGAIPEGAFEAMFKQRQERSLPAEMQGKEFPYELAWRPGGESQGEFIWPLPFDLTPTNEAILHLGDDGYPVGDLNWFGEDVVAAWEAGESNPLSARTIESVDLSLINYPNPFSSITQISYNLPASSEVTVKIYNTLGAEVATVVNEYQIAGKHEITFNSAALSGGVYFCTLAAGDLTQVHKMTLMK